MIDAKSAVTGQLAGATVLVTGGGGLVGSRVVAQLAAAYADVAACTRHPRTAFASNLAGTQSVLDTVAGSTVKRLVFVSSASVYGHGGTTADGPAVFT